MRSLAALWLNLMIAICATYTFGGLIEHHRMAVVLCLGTTVLAYLIFIHEPKRRRYSPPSTKIMIDWDEA